MRTFPPKLLLILSILAISPCAQAQQEFYPFFAEIIEDNVNVRAGENTNFEKLCQLEKNEGVIVVDKSYSWYKIQLPLRAKVYISEKYVLKQRGGLGLVVGDRVNLRAGPGIDHSVIGQVDKDTTVVIVDLEVDFFKIQPVGTSYGWVKEDYVLFKSGSVQPSSQDK